MLSKNGFCYLLEYSKGLRLFVIEWLKVQFIEYSIFKCFPATCFSSKSQVFKLSELCCLKCSYSFLKSIIYLEELFQYIVHVFCLCNS